MRTYPEPGNKCTVYVGNLNFIFCSSFIGGISDSVTEDELKNGFITFGPITEVLIPRDNWSKCIS